MSRFVPVFFVMFISGVAKAGLLVVDTDPTFPVMVLVDGNNVGPAPATVTDCSPGLHTVEIRHPDYTAKPRSVRCNSGLTELTVKLVSIGWNLSVSSNPTGLTASRDGKFLCTTPCTVTQRQDKSFRLRLESQDGLIRWERRVARKKRHTVKVHAAIETGFLSLNSLPLSGQIIVNGKRVLGRQAVRASLGKHQLELQGLAPGFRSSWHKKTVELTSAQRNIAVDPPLMKPPNPRSASFSQNKDLKQSPQELASDATAETALSDKQRRTRQKTISTMFRKPSFDEKGAMTGSNRVTKVDLRSEPSGAAIILDGLFRGRTPQTLTLTNPGSYMVDYQLQGFHTVSTPIQLDKQEHIRVVAKLKKRRTALSFSKAFIVGFFLLLPSVILLISFDPF